MNIVAIIQARLNSSRLPGKALLDLSGQPMIVHVVERARAIEGVERVLVAVPSADGKAFARVVTNVVTFSPLAEDDVLGRFAGAAKMRPADAYLRITGDTPLLAPDVAEHVIKRFVEERADYASNDTLTSGWPDGTDVECMSASLLKRANLEATDPLDREHVTRWMKTAQGVRTTTLRSPIDFSRHQWSVNTKHDLETVRAILAERPKDFTFAETLKAAEKAAKRVA